MTRPELIGALRRVQRDADTDGRLLASEGGDTALADAVAEMSKRLADELEGHA